jgi:hypothetical protein
METRNLSMHQEGPLSQCTAPGPVAIDGRSPLTSLTVPVGNVAPPSSAPINTGKNSICFACPLDSSGKLQLSSHDKN